MSASFKRDFFYENERDICEPSPEEKPRLENIKALLALTPEGQTALRFITEQDIPLSFADRGYAATYGFHRHWVVDKLELTPGSERIELDPHMPDERLAGSVIHEMRHALQVRHGVISPDRRVSPADHVWHDRVTEADAEAEAVYRTFRMKLAGYPELFDTRKGGFFTDMYRAAEEQYAKDPSSLDDGRLKRAAFDAWFTSLDSMGKHGYDSSIVDKGWKSLSERFDTVGGKAFPVTKLEREDVEKIGMVGGEAVNYLALPGFLPLDAPYYREDFAPGHEDKMIRLTEAWERKNANDNKPLRQKISDRLRRFRF